VRGIYACTHYTQCSWPKHASSSPGTPLTVGCYVTGLQTHVADQLRNFEMRTPAAGGELVIRALTHQFVPATADLLAESFSDAMGYMPVYR
jgi:hypothetical protein